MEYESVKSHEGHSVKITLLNNYWYRAKITKVTSERVYFIEGKGRPIDVPLEQVMMILPMNREFEVSG